MTDSILAIDPGESTGWSLWALDDDRPIQRLDYGLIHDGGTGYMPWAERHLGTLRPDLVIYEKFIPDGRITVADLVGLPVEGMIEMGCRALGIECIWQPNGMKAQVRDDVLRENGLYITNEEARTNPAINWKDARDVNDTQIHALGWAKFNHEPTLAAYWPEM